MNSMFHRIFQGKTGAMFLLFLPIFLQGQDAPPFVPDTLPAIDSLSFPLIEALSSRTAQQSLTLEQIWNRRALAVMHERTLMELQYSNAKLDTLLSKDSLSILSAQLKAARRNESEALKMQKKAGKIASQAQNNLMADSLTLRKNLPLAHKNLVNLYNLTFPKQVQPEKPLAEIVGKISVSDEPVPDAVNRGVPAATDSLPLTETPVQITAPPKKQYAVYRPANDVMLHPPKPPCTLAREQRDAFSGEMYRETQRIELFTFTNPVMRRVLEGKPHITCEAVLAQSGQLVNLHLIFTINDANARKTFGGFNKASLVMLQLMDGNTVSLNTLNADEGIREEGGQTYTFTARFAVDKASFSKISNSELDKIRVSWATGYEDYDIYRVNALIRLAQCLNSPKP